ncbi:thioredoxin family protein [Tolypothrix sp. FACHB-123]|uniref:thioredoxin family protein n=1 Tax=Tolypothrix sp. FACHB-123 TaxID=2692868 RepID=UPI001684382F|nr:thioredoxin family protein [Tolypothrix sp. FACHB-123]MBD2356032.1 thioredoxin family protein [Tolypothrix sp. FACHB-123]
MSTIKVEVFGTGCKKCQQLTANAKEAIANLGIEAEISHITDPIEIAQRGIISTPALFVNQKLISKGQVLPAVQIQQNIQQNILQQS